MFWQVDGLVSNGAITHTMLLIIRNTHTRVLATFCCVLGLDKSNPFMNAWAHTLRKFGHLPSLS